MIERAVVGGQAGTSSLIENTFGYLDGSDAEQEAASVASAVGLAITTRAWAITIVSEDGYFPRPTISSASDQD